MRSVCARTHTMQQIFDFGCASRSTADTIIREKLKQAPLAVAESALT